MKTNLTELYIALLLVIGIIVCVCCNGCTQVIIEKEYNATDFKQRLKINSFLMTSGLESLYYDPNNGFFEVGKYKGVPADVELEYDPLTHSFKVVTDSNE